MFEIYKRGQGRYTRIGTFAGMLAIVAIGVAVLADTLGAALSPSGYKVYLQYGIPVLIVGGVAWLMFMVVNRQKPADFLIATESEMKKVSWSSRVEVIGSTKVVIIVTLIMSFLLYGVDWVFVQFFSWTGVMGGTK